MGTQAESVISMYLSGLKKDYGGKRCVFNEERNKGKVGQDRSGRGREFQMDGIMGRQTKGAVEMASFTTTKFVQKIRAKVGQGVM